MKARVLFLAGVLGLAVWTTPVEARRASLAPSQVAVLPEDGSGVVRMAVRFDLSSLARGANRQIAWAMLEWRPSAFSGTGAPVFGVHAIASAWSPATVLGGDELAISEEVGFWDVDDANRDAGGGGLVRLDVTDVVQSWNRDAAANLGLLIVSPALSRSVASREASSIRLDVGYAFMP